MNLHIYISDLTEKQLQETCKRYHVSISVIVDVLLNNLAFSGLIEEWELTTKYLDQAPKHQTTIRISKENKERFLKAIPNSKTLFTSNAIYMYYHLDVLDISEESKNILKRNVGNALANKRDRYWDYNHQYRAFYRARKQYEREQEAKIDR